jgi:hypothetical protein
MNGKPTRCARKSAGAPLDRHPFQASCDVKYGSLFLNSNRRVLELHSEGIVHYVYQSQVSEPNYLTPSLTYSLHPLGLTINDLVDVWSVYGRPASLHLHPKHM